VQISMNWSRPSVSAAIVALALAACDPSVHEPQEVLQSVTEQVVSSWLCSMGRRVQLEGAQAYGSRGGSQYLYFGTYIPNRRAHIQRLAATDTSRGTPADSVSCRGRIGRAADRQLQFGFLADSQLHRSCHAVCDDHGWCDGRTGLRDLAAPAAGSQIADHVRR